MNLQTSSRSPTLTETWRLIVSEAAAGPTNMAVDEAILTHVGQSESPPTLRFYRWNAPWVSLGSAQRHADLDRAALAERGWRLLRRSSGGTAVLHQGQLGYAVILPTNHPLWAGDLARSYERLSRPLLHAFRSLGLSVEAAPPGANADFIRDAPALASAACFGALGPFEIVSASTGAKLVGNSQVRRKASSVQHGVIQVSGGQAPLAEVVAENQAERAALADYLARRVGSLSGIAERSLVDAEVVDALVRAFTKTNGVRFEPDGLTSLEHSLAAELVVSKYANDEWTYRR